MKVTDKQSTPWFLFCVVILVAIAAGVLVWQLNQHKPQSKPEQLASPATPAEVSATASELEPDVMAIAEEPAAAQSTTEVAEIIEEPELATVTADGSATLDKSDTQVAEYLAQSPAAALGEWLSPEHTIRKLVRAVNALEEGKLVSQHRPTVPIATAFKAQPKGDQWQLSEANFERYEPYIEALEQAGPKQLVSVYRYYSPLLEQAYQELGVDKGSFDQVTRGALKQIINAPQVDDNVTLSSTSVVFHYQDKELEQLPDLHKLLIRMGPENRERVQNLAQQLLQQLEQ